MKHFALTLFLFIALSLPAHAAKIAIADADLLMNTSEAAKSIKSQLKAQKDKFQQDFKTTQAVLKKQEQGIVQKRQNLTEDEFKKQIVEFRKKMTDEEKKFQRKKESLDQAFSKALQELQGEIGSIIQIVAKENGITHVVSKQSVLFAAAGQPDITKEVMSRLNAQKKTITVKTSN